MRTHRIIAVISPLLFVTLWSVSSLWSGSVDPSFESKLELLEGKEMVKAIVMMSEEVDLEALDNELIRVKATRQERHERVVRALQAMSQRTQVDIRRFLEEAMVRGEVEKIKPFWVANAIAVVATKDFTYRISERRDVGIIYEDLVIYLDKTNRSSPDQGGEPPTLHSAEIGLTSMNADSLWRLGITGNGVLVCNLDTGVDGNHEALGDRWRGNDPGVTPQEAWFDPYDNTTFPIDGAGHGTGTMGCITGVDHATGDTIGAAFGAKWIAARGSETGSFPSNIIIASFEWAIDPDGDPATIDDVPDVINNSWGGDPGCSATFWPAIDALRMSGMMVVFSAGNDGPLAQTIGSPGSRATSTTNVFAIGATNASNMIATFSSRGPSPCDGTTIKPEVVAHGSNVRTAARNGGYNRQSGTSFSAPYIAGAVALLREVSPSATGDEIMTAMMNTAVDLGTAGEDNTYGHGIPDLGAARGELLLMNPEPRIVFSGSIWDDGGNGEPEGGESADLIVHLGNLGTSATGVQATLSLVEPDSFITIDTNSSTFGDAGSDTTINNEGDPFHVTLDALTPGSHILSFYLDVTADGGAYSRQLWFTLRTPFVITMADHDVGNIRFSVSDGGKLGWEQEQASGSGFVYPIGTDDHMFEGSIIAGYDSVHVSHSARTVPAGIEGFDWQLLPGGQIQMTEPGVVSDQDGFSMYSDAGADNRLGVDIVQRSYAWSDSANEDFVIVELTVHNTGLDSLSDIENFYIGTYIDWDVQPFHAAVDTAYDVGYMYSPLDDKHCGVHVLTEPGVASFDLINNQDGSYQFTLAEYWASMSSGISDFTGNNQDWSYVLTTGPFDISAGDSIVVAFAVIAGDNLVDFLRNANAARVMYQVPVGVGDDVAGGGNLLPRVFGLSQNYPNPFNPSTTIRYEIPEDAGEGVKVTLEIFDIRGRKVRTLVNTNKEPGRYSVQWNGRGDKGEIAASGIYLYRLEAGDFQETRRMLLLK
jgi:subtilisin family serine protease